MKENLIQGLIATACGAVVAYFNILAFPLVILFAVMIIDYVTGLTEAWVNKTLSSRTGVIGILKKIGYFAAVAVGMVVDYLISSALVQCGIELHINYCFGMIVTIWLIVNELISILENLSEMGIPLPAFLTTIVKKLKVTVESKTDSESEE